MSVPKPRTVRTFAKRALRPAFHSALAAAVNLRWAIGGAKAARHGLPHRLIVSLTSYPKRYNTLALTLKCVLSQDIAADETILCIAHQDMDTLPQEVRLLEARGLTIRITDDLRSYKKILPLLDDYGDAAIVTADDDVFYSRSWLRTMVQAYRPGEPEVLCCRAHWIKFRPDGQLAPYKTWKFETVSGTADRRIFFTGVGGVFYPPGIFHADVANWDLIRDLCPTTDDVWFNWMIRLNGGIVRKVGPRIRFHEWPGTQIEALQNVNVGEGAGNDLQIANVIRVYGMAGIQR